MKNISDITGRLQVYVEANDYAGYDPYDAFNSPLVRALGSHSKWIGIALTQFFRRCPINLRPLFGVKKGHNPKGIGLFLWGYAKLYRIEPNETTLNQIQHLLGLLESLKTHGYSGNCWGYNFDWQSRDGFCPKGSPTIVNSSFVGHALLDCYEYTGLEQALNMACSIKDFILKDLNRQKLGGHFCFSYSPTDTDVIHNANMLGASLLIRLLKYTGDSACEEAALSSLAFSMSRQRDDGSWPYSEAKTQRWVDSFHTGFNLQALKAILDEGFAAEFREGFERGTTYYVETFFLADGTPKYFQDRVYPLDIHASAEGISFLATLGERYRAQTETILNWMVSNMLSPKGYFYFRKTKYGTNRIPYMRWTQAWAFHALTQYMLAFQSEDRQVTVNA